MWHTRKSQSLMVEKQNCTATLERRLDIFYKLNIRWPYDPGVPILGISPKKNESLISEKTLSVNIYNVGLTHPKCPLTDEQMKKTNCSTPYSEIFLSNKKGAIKTAKIMDASQTHVHWKKLDSKGYTVYDPTYSTFSDGGRGQRLSWAGGGDCPQTGSRRRCWRRWTTLTPACAEVTWLHGFV